MSMDKNMHLHVHMERGLVIIPGQSVTKMFDSFGTEYWIFSQTRAASEMRKLPLLFFELFLALVAIRGSAHRGH